MKRLLITLALVLSLPLTVLAASQAEVTADYEAELVVIGMGASDAKDKAAADVEAVIGGMKATQEEMSSAFDSLDQRVDNLDQNDGRLSQAKSALNRAKDRVSGFTEINRAEALEFVPAEGGPPRVQPSADFTIAQEEATSAMSEVNRVLIAPVRPGAVPEGDIVSDFLPQLIRQFYRIAWVLVLISFTVSGVYLVIAQDNEERVTNAKNMIMYSMIGFAVIALSFAIVKAITDIDFFRFI